MPWITPDGEYYDAGDNVAAGSTQVPVRPSMLHKWENSAWVLDPVKQRAEIQAQIDALEGESLLNRMMREWVVTELENTAIAYGAAQVPPLDAATSLAFAYATNIAYKKTKDLDVQVTALRTQMDAL